MPFKVVLPQPPQRASLFILYSGGSTLPLIYENRNWVLLGHIPDYPRNSSFEGYPSPINILIYYYSKIRVILLLWDTYVKMFIPDIHFFM